MKTENRVFFARLAILILPIILFGVGCTSSGIVKEIKPTEQKLSKFKTMIVNVISDGPASDQEVTQLSSMIVAKLQENNLFEKIYISQITPDVVADLNLNVNIQKINRVSYTKREWLGVFAGKAGIEVTATIVDTKTDKPVGNFAGEGKSGGHVFAGGTQQAIERAAEQLAEFVYENI